jgi:predicted esterase YcpF (UPF0227 family)
MRVAFLHGYESEPFTQKNIILRENFSEVYDPEIDYHDNSTFDKLLKHLIDNPVDLIIGSSMGGYLAYHLSTNLGIKTLLFNPAMHSKPVDIFVKTGDKVAPHFVVLGKNDDVIDPNKNKEFFKNIDNVVLSEEEFKHVIPIEIFRKYIKYFK